MELSPRWDAAPIIEIDGPFDAVRTPLRRQRRRLAALLDGLDADAWEAPTRCAGWRVRDVVAHLADTDWFWTLSLQSGVAGTPSRMLEGFDPKATPAAMVSAAAGASRTEVAERFHARSAALLDAVEGLDDAGWAATAEAPPGHVSISVMAHHALWDCWVHERDIALPLGLPVVEEDDEVLAALRYAAALSPAFALSLSPERHGALALETSAPDATIVVEVGDAARVRGGPVPAGASVLSAPAVALLEAFSVRAPFPVAVSDDDAWLVSGLSEVFESTAERTGAAGAVDTPA
jgi:uncharacterized protein (TIGR03083 family)